MATTGWTFKGKFYAYGSELPKELKDTLKERGLDEKTSQPLKPEPEAAPATDQNPVDAEQPKATAKSGKK